MKDAIGAEKVRRIVRALKTFARAHEEQRLRLDVHSVIDLSISMLETDPEPGHGATLTVSLPGIPVEVIREATQ